jgi:hypothetical protein
MIGTASCVFKNTFGKLKVPENKVKIKKSLRKTANSNKLNAADDLICIPRPLYLQMISLLKGQLNNGGRAKNLLSELPLADKTE